MLRETTQAPELMTVDEFSRWWRQSRATTYRQIQAGQIPVVRIRENGALRIPRDRLEAQLAGREGAER